MGNDVEDVTGTFAKHLPYNWGIIQSVSIDFFFVWNIYTYRFISVIKADILNGSIHLNTSNTVNIGCLSQYIWIPSPIQLGNSVFFARHS